MEDLSQRRNETNFMYSRRIQQYNLDKEQEKHNRTVQMQTEKVMNKKTDRTSLHHSNSSIFQDSDVLAARDIYSATTIGAEIIELMKQSMPSMNLKRRTALRDELKKVVETEKQKKMKKRYSFNPNAMNKCI
jgi:6-phosphofructokinase